MRMEDEGGTRGPEVTTGESAAAKFAPGSPKSSVSSVKSPSVISVVIGASAALALLIPLSSDYYSNTGPIAYFATLVASAVIGLLVLMLSRPRDQISDRGRSLLGLACIITGGVAFLALVMRFGEAEYAETADGMWYRQMGQSFRARGEFYIYGGYTRHYPPLYPMILSGFYAVSDSVASTRVATSLLHFASILAVFLTTRSLFGNSRGLLAAGIISLFPTFIFFDARNSSEHLVLLLFTLTLYCIYRSLEPAKRHYIVLAGVLAGLGYLSKSSVGYFFILAGVIGFAWRWYYMRSRVLKDRWYLLAIALFLTIVTCWAYRNLRLFWDGSAGSFLDSWQTSYYFVQAGKYVTGEALPAYFAEFGVMLSLTLVLVAGYLWPFIPWYRRSLRLIRDERISFHWIAFTIPLALAAILTPVFYVFEVHTLPQWWSYSPEHQIRYFVLALTRYAFIAFVPALWLAWEVERKPGGREWSERDSSSESGHTSEGSASALDVSDSGVGVYPATSRITYLSFWKTFPNPSSVISLSVSPEDS